MYALEDLLADAASTEFVVVTVPTMLAVKESERLVGSLGEAGIAVHHVVVNQVLPAPASSEAQPTALPVSYASRLRRGQGTCGAELRSIAAGASAVGAIAAGAPGSSSGPAAHAAAGRGAPGSSAEVQVTEVPWLEVEATGLQGLRALAKHLI